MSARSFLLILIVNLSLLLTTCGDDDGGGGGNGKRRGKGAPNATQFSVGNSHACAVLKNSGKVACWGNNASGQLGDGTTTNRTAPVETKLGEGRIARVVAAGWNHTCAILDDDSLVCWGGNDYSQVKHQGNSQENTPVAVGVGSGKTVKAVSLGERHTCALLNDNTLNCWGDNAFGQLGDGSLPGDVRSISTGAKHNCALFADGSVQCWGSNTHGQLGNGTTGSGGGTPVTVALPGDKTALSIHAGDEHTCALLEDNSLSCWGLQTTVSSDRTASSGSIARPYLRVFENDQSVLSVAMGGTHVCVILDDNSTTCWGTNDHGQFGNEASQSSAIPEDVDLGGSVPIGMGAGGNSTCALFEDGSLACWGSNSAGQLGIGKTTRILSPTLVETGDDTISSIDGGGKHGCARFSDNSLRCWGENERGQLGDNGQLDRFEDPVEITFGDSKTATSVSTGELHTCAILSDNTLACWGYNGSGRVGQGDSSGSVNAPASIGLGPGRTAQAVSAGGSHTCAILDNGKMSCWGEGRSGQLGEGESRYRAAAYPVTLGSKTAKKVSAGGTHTCAILNNDKVWCWGKNSSGQLGLGGTTDRDTPGGVNLGTDGDNNAYTATAVSAGNNHNCAILNDKSVKCWGDNGSGQVGDGSTTTRKSPVAVGLGSNRTATAIHAKGNHTCAILDNGSLVCWGKNDVGQLGDGTTTNRNTPVEVDLGDERTATAVGGGNSHTCAILDNGTTKCWGNNSSGQATFPTTHRGDQPGEMGENLIFVDLDV